MYSVIFVDDERRLRESIEQIVAWEQNGFHLIGTAENGLDALQLMKKTKIPDLIITDIKMPVMDGIELAERLRDEYPTIKIVFLSGYDEFHYAVEGIKLNVVSYMLKPVSKDNVEECLLDIKDQLDEEMLAANDLNQLKENYNKNIELIKLSFLNSLITENYLEINRKELRLFLETQKLNYLEKPKMLLTIRFVKNSNKMNEPNNSEFKRFSLFQLVQDITGKYAESEVFLFSTYIVCILTGSEEGLYDISDIVTKDITETVRRRLKEEIVIGISEVYQDIFYTNKAYHSAIAALDYTKPEDNENVIFIADVENTSLNANFLDDLDENTLLLAIKRNNKEFVTNILEKFLNDKYYVSENRISMLRIFTSIIYVNCMRALRETVGMVDDSYNDWYNHIFELTQYGELAVIQDELLEFCQYTMTEIQKNRAEQKSTLIVESLEYLEENFAKSDISLKTICQYLNVSPSYFSSIFKKETGKSFIDTLTELKMNKARDLVLTTDMKIFEIAFECGYEDQHYFSYSFKKHFGLSPTKMRIKSENESSQLQSMS